MWRIVRSGWILDGLEGRANKNVLSERKRRINYDSRLLPCTIEKKNYGGDVETMEIAGLEGGDQAFMLDIVNLRCLLDIQVEMNPHYYSPMR